MDDGVLLLGRLMEASSHGNWPAEDAVRLMKLFGSTGNLFSSGQFALSQAKLSDAQMTLIMTVNAAARRCAIERLGPSPFLGDAKTLEALARAIFIGARGERFAVICADRRMRLIEWTILSEGTADEIILQGEKLYERVALSDAAAVVFCHNHPGGSTSFSAADIESTRVFGTGLQRLGVALTDHLLIADGQVISMRRSGLPAACFSDPLK